MSAAWHGGKGTRPRPLSVDTKTFDANWDAIFKKGKEMTPKVEDMKKGTCGCGRSPTGDCCGWHGLSEEQFQEELAKYREKVFEQKTREE